MKKPDGDFMVMAINIPGMPIADFSKAWLDEGISHREVIGGNHTRCALQSILRDLTIADEIREQFALRPCKVYCDLSDLEARRIGALHNQVQQLSKADTFIDTVKEFRQLLLVEDGFLDTPDYTTEVTTDKRTIQKWKDTIMKLVDVHGVRHEIFIYIYIF